MVSQAEHTPRQNLWLNKQTKQHLHFWVHKSARTSTEARVTTMKPINKAIDGEQGREKKGGAFAVVLGRKDVKGTFPCQELAQSQLWTAVAPVTEQGCKESLN